MLPAGRDAGPSTSASQAHEHDIQAGNAVEMPQIGLGVLTALDD
jgi:hypothetical protein